jgi:hypothetical protein
VVVIPGSRAGEVIEMATRISEQEKALLLRVKSDTVTSWDEV